MSKKLEGNGLWESSRMMLPEHKERIRSRRKEMNRKQRPELDALELERFYRLLAESAAEGTQVRLTLFGEFEDQHRSGTVSRIDALHGRVKLRVGSEEEEWFEVRDLVGVDPVAVF
jgi:nucleoid DNA-binding protein